jgi:hypothetical protein
MYKARHFGFRYAVKMKRGMAVLEPQSILNSGGGTLALHARDVNDLQLQKKGRSNVRNHDQPQKFTNTHARVFRGRSHGFLSRSNG